MSKKTVRKPKSSTKSSSEDINNKPQSDIINFYELLPKKYRDDKIEYPNYSQIRIDVPFRMIITGATGSGKTNFLLNIILKINCFNKIYLYAKDIEESLYANFIDTMRENEKKLGEHILDVSTDISSIPDPSSLNKKQNHLLIIDDMVQEKSKDLDKVAQYWTRGRKRNCSALFLTQRYYGTPGVMRQNSELFAFLTISTEGDLLRILRDHEMGVSEEQLKQMYWKAVEGGFPNGVFLIDKNAVAHMTPYRFRRNFNPIPIPEDTMKHKLNTIKESEEDPNEMYSQFPKKNKDTAIEWKKHIEKDDESDVPDSSSSSDEEIKPKIKKRRISTKESLKSRIMRLAHVYQIRQSQIRRDALAMGMTATEYCNELEKALQSTAVRDELSNKLDRVHRGKPPHIPY